MAEAIFKVYELDSGFRYDFAVICAQLLDTAAARFHLEAAFDRPEGRELKLRALEDRALDVVWREPNGGP